MALYKLSLWAIVCILCLTDSVLCGTSQDVSKGPSLHDGKSKEAPIDSANKSVPATGVPKANNIETPVKPAPDTEGKSKEAPVDPSPTANKSIENKIETPVNPAPDTEDEFEEAPIDALPAAFKAVPATGVPKPKPNKIETPARPPPDTVWNDIYTFVIENYVIDISALVILILVVLDALYGKETNSSIAKAWIESNLSILQQQFSAVGFEKSIWVLKAYHQFELFCTGRRNCHFLYATLDCIPRQCFWRGRVLHNLIPSLYERDLLTIEILLDSKVCDGAIVGLCRKTHQRDFVSAFWDIAEFTKSRSIPQSANSDDVLDDFVLMTDTQESADLIVLSNKTFQRVLSTCGQYLVSFYFSDLCNSTNPSADATICNALGNSNAVKASKSILRFSFFVPPPAYMEDIQPLLQLSLFMIDYVASIQLSDRTRETVKKLRMAYQKERGKEEEEARQQLIEKKKQQKRQEEQERLAKMDSTQRQKFEDQKSKKELKARRAKMKVLKA